MRIAVGGITQETSTFSVRPTGIEQFQERFLYRGADVLSAFAGTNTPIGGFVAEAERNGIELMPTLFAEAHPGGPASAELFESLADELVSRIREAGPLDGVVLALHGSMVAEEHQDCEGDILAAVRSAVGVSTPIVAQLDIHANVSQAMVDRADVLVGRRSYPEIDMFERGEECVRIARAMALGAVRPQTALRLLPFVWGINQATGVEPMAAAMRQLESTLRSPEVLTAAISTGYPYSDAFCLGASVQVTADGDGMLAAQFADGLVEWITDRREQWFAKLPTTAEALEQALRDGSYPVLFADRFDNTGAGTPGDSTGMLATFLAADLQDACILYIVDPVSVAACREAGPGSTIELDVGGRSAPDQGPPVPLSVTVEAVSDGAFRYGGEMYRGLSSSMGRSAHIRHRGIHLILVSVREQPYDTAFAHTLGLFPERMRFIGLKSQAHFRSGFESWAGAVHIVAEPSIHNPRSGSLAYRHARPEIKAHVLEA